ncbi:MAG: glutamine-binding periplasmic protein of glutamine transporter [Reyranella sp.]|nr:glutamine-binding periplasmic protein of glutamine transporter [Reyranella sp.]
MDIAFLLRILPVLLEGLEITVALTAIALVGAAIGGFIVVAGRRSRFAAVRAVTIGYIDVMRNTPVLAQIFILYFGLPEIGLYPEAFSCGVIALVLQNSAYAGEIYRAGIESVKRTQTEAALSLGMMPRRALFDIVLPQALRRVLPVLGNQAVVILKDSSIASTISVAELTQAGKLLLDRSAAPYETFFMMAALYLAMAAIILGAMKLVALRFPVRT